MESVQEAIVSKLFLLLLIVGVSAVTIVSFTNFSNTGLSALSESNGIKLAETEEKPSQELPEPAVGNPSGQAGSLQDIASESPQEKPASTKNNTQGGGGGGGFSGGSGSGGSGSSGDNSSPPASNQPTGSAPQSAPNQLQLTITPEPIEWLKTNQDKYTTGLVESQPEFGDSRVFTYDQALAVIAFVKAGEMNRARKILDKMKGLQNSQGYWRSAYYASNGDVWEWNIDTGPIAWMIIAAIYYQEENCTCTYECTGSPYPPYGCSGNPASSSYDDRAYSAMIDSAIDWLETRIDTNISSGSYGALNLGTNWWNVPNPEERYGTEYQFDAYAAFKERAKVLRSFIGRMQQALEGINDDIVRLEELLEDPNLDPVMRESLENLLEAMIDSRAELEFHIAEAENYSAELSMIAENIMNYLVRAVWKEDHFWRGYQDPEKWLDTLSWAAMSLGNTGPGGEDFAGALTYAENNMRQIMDWNSDITNVKGFGYNNYQNSLWVEGTAQMAYAYSLQGKETDANYYLNEVARVTREDKGLPYSFNNQGLPPYDWPLNLRYSALSSTAWYYFADQKFNPFHFEITSIACYLDSDCDDSNAWTIDSCINPGTIQSYCSRESLTTVIQTYSFESGSEGWVFNSVPGFFSVPGSGWANGSLRLTSVDANTFGFWASPSEIQILADKLYFVRYKVSTDESDLASVPQTRLRYNAQSEQKAAYLVVPTAYGQASAAPTVDGRNYYLFFKPPESSIGKAGMDKLYLSFDLTNFDVSDNPTASVFLQEAEVSTIETSSVIFREVKRYTFDYGEEGWTHFGAPSAFNEPSYSNYNGMLKMTANDKNTFGFWRSPNELPAESGKLYRLRFKVSSDVADREKVPQFRLRVNLFSEEYASVELVTSNNGAESSPVNGEVKEYESYFTLPENTPTPSPAGMYVSFDLVNIGVDEQADTSIMLDELIVEEAVNLTVFK